MILKIQVLIFPNWFKNPSSALCRNQRDSRHRSVPYKSLFCFTLSSTVNNWTGKKIIILKLPVLVYNFWGKCFRPEYAGVRCSFAPLRQEDPSKLRQQFINLPQGPVRILWGEMEKDTSLSFRATSEASSGVTATNSKNFFLEISYFSLLLLYLNKKIQSNPMHTIKWQISPIILCSLVTKRDSIIFF